MNGTIFVMNKSEWHQWRSKGLGASDAPIILGLSPWKDRITLWKEKIGEIKKDYTSNWAIDRGNRLEPIARAHYELMVDYDCPPQMVEHGEFPWLRASLDGYNPVESVVLEIKCPGKADHQKALDSKVPKKYYAQLQHQLLVTRAKRCDYFSFDGSNGVIVQVLPDPQFMLRLFCELRDFWECIEKRKEPSKTIEDLSLPGNVE